MAVAEVGRLQELPENAQILPNSATENCPTASSGDAAGMLVFLPDFVKLLVNVIPSVLKKGR